MNRKTLKVAKRIKVGINVWDVAFAFGSAWATNNYDGTVVRINPATNRIVKTIKTGAQPTNFGIAKDAIWVGDNSASGQNVFRIDPATNTSTSVPVGHARPSGIIVTADAVWVANGDATVVRIDPATKAVVATVKIGHAAAAGRRRPRRNDLDPESDRRHGLGDRPADEHGGEHDQAEDGHGAVRPSPRLRRHVGRQLPRPFPLAHPALTLPGSCRNDEGPAWRAPQIGR